MKVLMGKDEIAIIRGHLQPSHVMLEWGAGGSTVYYPQFVAAYFSVEHDRGWFRKVKEASSQQKPDQSASRQESDNGQAVSRAR